MSVQYTVYLVHWGMLSTLGDAQYTGGNIMNTVVDTISTVGYHEYTGGYHEYSGGYREYTRGCSVHWGIS